jgi:hypothetical protein
VIALLAGGTGGAKLARGMLDVVGADELAVIANTGDDIAAFGLHVSPDPDLITYWLQTKSTMSAATGYAVIARTPSSDSSSLVRQGGFTSATATSRPACSALSCFTKVAG